MSRACGLVYCNGIVPLRPSLIEAVRPEVYGFVGGLPRLGAACVCDGRQEVVASPRGIKRRVRLLLVDSNYAAYQRLRVSEALKKQVGGTPDLIRRLNPVTFCWQASGDVKRVFTILRTAADGGQARLTLVKHFQNRPALPYFHEAPFPHPTSLVREGFGSVVII